jgi:hypothetical protein
MENFLTSPTCKKECDSVNAPLKRDKENRSCNEKYLMDSMNDTCCESKDNFLFISKNEILDETTEKKDENISSQSNTFFIPQNKSPIISSFIENSIQSEQGDASKQNSITKTNQKTENEANVDFFKICSKTKNGVSKEERTCNFFYSLDPFMQRQYDSLCYKPNNLGSNVSLEEPHHESNAFSINSFQTKSSSFSSFTKTWNDPFTSETKKENAFQIGEYRQNYYQDTNSLSMDPTKIDTENFMQPALEHIFQSKYSYASNPHSSCISFLQKSPNRTLPKSNNSILFENNNKPYCSRRATLANKGIH